MLHNPMSMLITVLIATFVFYYLLPRKIRWIVLLAASLVFFFLASKYLIVFVLGTALGVYLVARYIRRLYDAPPPPAAPATSADSHATASPDAASADSHATASSDAASADSHATASSDAASADSGATAASTPKRSKPRKARTHAERVKRAAKGMTAAVILANLAVLGFLKYFDFFGQSICSFLSFCGANVHFRALRLLLPIGISFYTLQAIGYVIDVYRRKYPAEKNFAKLLLFLTFFPLLTEGPICRYDQIGAQLCEGHAANYKDITFGAQRILWGIFKKTVIADRVFLLVHTISESPYSYSGVASLLFILGYTLQLYADFAGCMDIALGSAQVLGIRLPENFRRPFFASSAQEFWQRWHITLGTWLKDYVFYSVALSPAVLKFGKAIKRKHKNHFTKTLPTGIALLAVWLCNGLWHGPEWRYIVYGLYYFVLIFAGMLCQPLFAKLYKKIRLNPQCVGMKIFRHVRTLLIIFVGETIFGAPSLPAAMHLLGSLFTPYHGSMFSLGLDGAEFIVLLCGVAMLLTFDVLGECKYDVREGVAALPLPLRWALYILLVVAIVLFGAYGSGYTTAPFMYGNF